MIGDEFVRHKWSSRLAPLVIQYVNAWLLIISEKCSSINVNIHWTTIFLIRSSGSIETSCLWSFLDFTFHSTSCLWHSAVECHNTLGLSKLKLICICVFEYCIFVFVFFVFVYLWLCIYTVVCTCDLAPVLRDQVFGLLACLAAAQPRWPAATFQWAAQAPLINTSPHVLQILCATSNPRVRPKIYNPFQYLEAAECFGEGRNTGFACFQLTFNYLTRGDWNFWLFGQKQKKYQFTGKNIKLVQQSKTLSSAWQAFQLQTHIL